MWSQHPHSVPESSKLSAGPEASGFTEYDLVVLKVDRPELGLRAGDVGTVLSVRGSRCRVEFGAPGGACAGVLSERPSALRPLRCDELFHVRRLDPPVRASGPGR